MWGRPSLEEKHLECEVFYFSKTECPEKAWLDTKALVRGVIQNLGSRGQQRPTTWTCCGHCLADEYSVIPPLASSSEDGSLVYGLCIGILMNGTY